MESIKGARAWAIRGSLRKGGLQRQLNTAIGAREWGCPVDPYLKSGIRIEAPCTNRMHTDEEEAGDIKTHLGQYCCAEPQPSADHTQVQ